MKIKQFVTNSSSCNFVLLGYEIPIKRKQNEDLTLSSKRTVLKKFYRNRNTDNLPPDKIERLFEELFSNHLPVIKVNEEFGAPNSHTILIGPELFNSDSEEDPEPASISLEILSKWIDDVKSEYNFEEEPKLFFGTKAC